MTRVSRQSSSDLRRASHGQVRFLEQPILDLSGSQLSSGSWRVVKRATYSMKDRSMGMDHEWMTTVVADDCVTRALILRYVSCLDPQLDRTTQPLRITVAWRYATQTGMPSDQDHELMDLLEDRMEDVFERTGLATLVTVTTGRGTRAWTFYTDCRDRFEREMRVILADFENLPLQLRSEPDPDWSHFETLAHRVASL